GAHRMRAARRPARRCSTGPERVRASQHRTRLQASQSAWAPRFTETGALREWLASDLEIDGDDVFAEGHAELRDWDVLIVVLIGVECRAIRKRNRQTGVVRPRRSHDVCANLQVDDAV